MFKTFVPLFILTCVVLVQSMNETLLSVIVIFRHGERTPRDIYKNDPYDESHWPQGLGELTNVGKRQQYSLGKWFRKRYNGFLPNKYNKKDIKVLSSNVDRCLMSAASNLAGLYPPVADQMWHQKLQWQPIPIHTTPAEKDILLNKQRDCAKYDRLYDEFMRSEYVTSFFKENKELVEYLSEHTGEEISTMEQINDLYDILFVESANNLTLPEWTRSVFPKKFKPLIKFGWPTFTYTTDLARLRSGPLVDYIVDHFDKIVSGTENTPKFLMLSTHDTTIVNLLNSLHAFYPQWPAYTTTIIFELKTNGSNNFVNVLLKNSTEPAKITPNNCGFNCDFVDFKEFVEPLRINEEDWEKECSEN